jgi:hypothetical protein
MKVSNSKELSITTNLNGFLNSPKVTTKIWSDGETKQTNIAIKDNLTQTIYIDLDLDELTGFINSLTTHRDFLVGLMGPIKRDFEKDFLNI